MTVVTKRICDNCKKEIAEGNKFAEVTVKDGDAGTYADL